MELLGEFLGLDEDKAIFNHFRRFGLEAFPDLAHLSRTTFVRQSASLWRVKQLLHGRLLSQMPFHDELLWLVDSFPLHVCRFARAKGCRLFDGEAGYGHDHVARQTYYGFRVHVRCSDEGPLGQIEITAANVADLTAASALAPPQGGIAIGDRAYWGPDQAEQLANQDDFQLLAPYKKKADDPNPERSKLLTKARRLIETVIGQLTERYHCARTKARDLWHLTQRLGRKLLSHTAAVLLNIQQGNPPLQLSRLLAE